MSAESKKSNIIRVPGRELSHKWLRPASLKPFWDFMSKRKEFDLKLIGHSVEGREIYALDWGYGLERIMAWSQMHGNESTASYALIDLCECILNGALAALESKLRLRLIIMLNPDGSEYYKRRNAVGIDLNRDVISREAPETKAFFKALEDFDPHWAFNLHDQRNIFAAGDSGRTATLSFLAPSFNLERSINPDRKKTMQLIAAIHKQLEDLAPAHFGRYTDEFYPRALGDNLVKQGVPCLLFESGAYPDDPKRKKARELCYEGFKAALELIVSRGWKEFELKDYWSIPENQSNLRDMIFRDLDFKGLKIDLALMRVEKVNPDSMTWEEYYKVDDIGDLKHLKGIEEYNQFSLEATHGLDLDQKAEFVLSSNIKNFKFSNGILQKR